MNPILVSFNENFSSAAKDFHIGKVISKVRDELADDINSRYPGIAGRLVFDVDLMVNPSQHEALYTLTCTRRRDRMQLFKFAAPSVSELLSDQVIANIYIVCATVK